MPAGVVGVLHHVAWKPDLLDTSPDAWWLSELLIGYILVDVVFYGIEGVNSSFFIHYAGSLFAMFTMRFMLLRRAGILTVVYLVVCVYRFGCLTFKAEN
jgi:hypothetical protein